jgi:opacity protein-like surface antigen
MRRVPLAAFAAAILIAPLAAAAQEGQAERFNVPLTDPARPVRLEVGLVSGGITVEAGGGNQVVVEARAAADDRRPGKTEVGGGMRRIPLSGFRLSIEEKDNVVEIGSSPTVAVFLTIKVPEQTSVKLSTVNDGDIEVNGVRGDHEISNVNGEIRARVAGSLVAHTINGEVKVVLSAVAPDKAMAFSSLNGDVDVTLPGGTKADLRMESENGEIYTDFDVAMRQRAAPAQTERQGGRYTLTVERAVFGTINGGGPEMHFKTFNGNVHLRRAGG